MRSPQIIAHRGARARFPENTVEAFAEAVRLGVDGLELDVRRSADGEVVVCHDETVDRTTDGRGAVARLTWAQLQALDAGARWTPHADPEQANGGLRGGPTPHAGRGIRLPRLQDVLEAFPQMPLVIELKTEEVAGPALAVLGRFPGARDRVTVGSYWHEALVPLRRAGYRTTASRRELLRLAPVVALGGLPARPPFDVVSVPPRWGLWPVPVRRFAAALELPVHLWTVNAVAEARHWAALGVSALLTDDPAALLSATPPIASPPRMG